MTFGERLIALRKEKGYTRESFAEFLGISKYTLRNYELSVNEPGSSFLKQISNIFNVSMDYLMGVTDEPEVLKEFRLRPSEAEHIKKYRILDEHGKEMVDFTLLKEWERVKADIEEAQPSIKEFREEPNYLSLGAAHNEGPQTKEELDLMREDAERLKNL